MRKYLAGTILSAMIIFSSFEMLSLPTEAAGDGELAGLGNMIVEVNEENEVWDHQELFDGYVDRLLYSELNGDVGVCGNLGETELATEEAKTVYTALKKEVCRIASGERNSTDILLEGIISWDAKALGGEKITQENIGIILGKKIAETLDFNAIMGYLRMDCPYELYWYDETSRTEFKFGGFSNDGKSLVLDIQVKLPVEDEYQNGRDDFSVDTAAVLAAKEASKYALEIVNANAAASDYEKLVKYKDVICELTSYDHGASDTPGRAYGNPWQIINVFDKNPATKVVCEGYAKAFQYLCDLSGLTCYTVSGVMSGGTGDGAHMWNIVTLDGKNYLVDVTNCDEGTIGYPDKLFLAGTNGSVKAGYTFPLSYNVSYYYYTNQEALLGSDILTLASSGYEKKLTGQWISSSKGWWYRYSDGSYPSNGWDEINGKWYWFDKSGYMKTGWLQTGGTWYYLSSGGAMVTGWQSIGGVWYYFNPSGAMLHDQWVGSYYLNSNGAMATGWVNDRGTWYYMNGSGIMVKGWLSTGGKWYYMSSSGKMCTGWVQNGGKWYYMNSDGVMVTGWLQLGSTWYYLQPNGEMAVGQVKISGRVNKFNSSGVWLGY